MSVKRSKTLLEKYSQSDVVNWKGTKYRVDWHQERDNADITVTNDASDEVVYDNYDPEDIAQLLADGLFNWEESTSLIKYLDSVGSLNEVAEGGKPVLKQLRMADIISIVDKHIEAAFAEAQQKAGITTGDIDPMDHIEVSKAMGILGAIIERQIRYNQPPQEN